MFKRRLALPWIASPTTSVYIIRNINIAKSYVEHPNLAVLVATVHTNTYFQAGEVILGDHYPNQLFGYKQIYDMGKCIFQALRHHILRFLIFNLKFIWHKSDPMSTQAKLKEWIIR